MDEKIVKNFSRNTNLLAVFMTVLVLSIAAGLAMVVVRSYKEDRQNQNEYYPSFERAYATLTVLADKGCQVPFDECLHPGVATIRVLNAMDREKIAFGTDGVTQAKLDRLEAFAEVRIAGQKFAYLKANGGVKYPSDLALLEDVCMQVYVKKRFIQCTSQSCSRPTDQELKNLLPPGVTKPVACDWDEERK